MALPCSGEITSLQIFQEVYNRAPSPGESFTHAQLVTASQLADKSYDFPTSRWYCHARQAVVTTAYGFTADYLCAAPTPPPPATQMIYIEEVLPHDEYQSYYQVYMRAYTSDGQPVPASLTLSLTRGKKLENGGFQMGSEINFTLSMPAGQSQATTGFTYNRPPQGGQMETLLVLLRAGTGYATEYPNDQFDKGINASEGDQELESL